MSKINTHNNQNPHKKFPKPTTSADEAWTKMSALLDEEIPVSTSKKRGFTSVFSQIIIAVAAMTILGGGIFIGYKVIENSKYKLKPQKTHVTTNSPFTNLTPKNNIDRTLHTYSEKNIQNRTSIVTNGKKADTSMVSFRSGKHSTPMLNLQVTNNQKGIKKRNLRLILKQEKMTITQINDDANSRVKNTTEKDDNEIIKNKLDYNTIDKKNNNLISDDKNQIIIPNFKKTKIETQTIQEKTKRNEEKSSLFFEKNELCVSLSSDLGSLFHENTDNKIILKNGILNFGIKNTKYKFSIVGTVQNFV